MNNLFFGSKPSRKKNDEKAIPVPFFLPPAPQRLGKRSAVSTCWREPTAALPKLHASWSSWLVRHLCCLLIPLKTKHKTIAIKRTSYGVLESACWYLCLCFYLYCHFGQFYTYTTINHVNWPRIRTQSQSGSQQTCRPYSQHSIFPAPFVCNKPTTTLKKNRKPPNGGPILPRLWKYNVFVTSNLDIDLLNTLQTH